MFGAFNVIFALFSIIALNLTVFALALQMDLLIIQSDVAKALAWASAVGGWHMAYKYRTR